MLLLLYELFIDLFDFPLLQRFHLLSYLYQCLLLLFFLLFNVPFDFGLLYCPDLPIIAHFSLRKLFVFLLSDLFNHLFNPRLLLLIQLFHNLLTIQPYLLRHFLLIVIHYIHWLSLTRGLLSLLDFHIFVGCVHQESTVKFIFVFKSRIHKLRRTVNHAGGHGVQVGAQSVILEFQILQEKKVLVETYLRRVIQRTQVIVNHRQFIDIIQNVLVLLIPNLLMLSYFRPIRP